MDKIATCFEASGNDSTDSGGPLSMMLLMQQQMSQQQEMQQFQSMQQLQMQQFQQSIQNQMQAMERHANRSEKLLKMFMQKPQRSARGWTWRLGLKMEAVQMKTAASGVMTLTNLQLFSYLSLGIMCV